jgi:hypothetical protein
MKRKTIKIIGAVTGFIALAGITTGIAAASTDTVAGAPNKLCYNAGGSVLAKDNTCPVKYKTFEGTVGPKGATGANGKTGAPGIPGSPASMSGAFYAVANYTNGGDGWATVVCIDNTTGSEADSANYTAIAGGVEEDDAPGNSGPAGSDVITSFPGRMDWDTNSPTGALDGWVVGLSGGDNTPLKVWALCVPDKDFGSSAPKVITNSYS